MKRKVVTCVVSLAILFITASFSQADTFDLAKMNSPPTTPSVLTGETSCISGTSSSYITKSNDPDGNQLKYIFDWGDGTVSTTCLVNPGVFVRVFHAWNSPSGSKAFSVRAKATDRYGSSSSWSNPIYVNIADSISHDQVETNNPPGVPAVPSGSTSGTSGTFYSYSTKGTDPDGDQVRYSFDWGDGIISTAAPVTSGTSASAYHAWTVAPGSAKTFSVRAKTTDESGMASSWSSPLSVTIKGPTAVNNPPGTPAVPSGSTSGSSGMAYNYATKGTDPDGDRVKYTFDWGDGTTSITSLVASGTSGSASHTWTVAPGFTKTFSVSARATDESGMDSSWSSPLSVTIKGPAAVNNPPPTPSIPSGSTSGSSGTAYTYSTKCTDPDGDDVKYSFYWGDGIISTAAPVTSGTSGSASHTWTVAPGSTKTFSVFARATDESGMASSWSSPLSVTIKGPAAVNNPPGTPAVPSGSTSGSSGTAYTYSTKCIDPDGDDVKYTFDWGDGTTSATSLVSSGTSASAFHKWTVASGTTKTFSVSAKATDEGGKESGSSDVISVTIKGPDIVVSASNNNPPRTPRIPEGNLVGRTTYTYTYKTMANDPDGDMVKYTFDWGDGNTSTTGYVPSGAYASASHKWSGITPGTFKGFSIKAIATDINGGKSAWSSPLPVSMGAPYVNHRPSIPVVSGLTQCKSGTPCKFTIVADDPDEKDTLKYLIHWGDYSTETAYFPSGQPATVYHTWNVPAGKTWTCKIIAVAVDPYQLGSTDWSEPLVVTVTGPSLSSTTSPLMFADELGPEADENETVYAQTEELDFADAQIEENQSEVDQTGEAEPVDSQIEEDQSIVEQTEENLIVDELATEDYNIAVDDTYYIASNDSVLKINAPGVLENDQYRSDKSLSVSSYSQPAYAADFSMNSDGSFTYTASQDYCGEDSFTYKTTDGDLESNEATVAILIDCSLHNDEEVLY